VQGWGVTDAREAHFAVLGWWDKMITAREKYLEKNPLRPIPRGASEAEKRLLGLLDKLRADITRRGRHSKARYVLPSRSQNQTLTDICYQSSLYALDRLPSRERAWKRLLDSDPKALVVRDPYMRKASPRNETGPVETDGTDDLNDGMFTFEQKEA
jgi:hypothetical protein